MSKLKLILLSLTMTALLIPLPIAAAAQDVREGEAPTPAEPTGEPFAGDVLCPADAYLQEPEDCLVLGPSMILTDLAKMGVTLPPPPLPARHTPNDLAEISYRYIRITYRGSVPVHISIPDAIAGNVSRSIGLGFVYLSYNARQDSDHGIFYRFGTGEWIWGTYVSRITPPTFEGFIFNETPSTGFGWVLDPVESTQTPGVDGIYSGLTYNRFDVVPVFQTTRVDDTDWHLVGASEWIEDRFLAKVEPYLLPPEGVDNNRWIELDLNQQTITVYDQGKLVFATLTSSGSAPFHTKPGLFQIQEKLPAETMSTGDPSYYYYLEDVPWTMYYDEERALHGAYWHSRFGYTRSHGCVNMSIADARWLYDWANIGDWVYVWDPSGKTPTDPSLYTSGGP